MTKEFWDYDNHSHRVILNVGQGWSGRKSRKERNISSNLLNRPRMVVLIIIIIILSLLLLKESRSVLVSNPQFVIQDVIFESTGLITKEMLYDILKLNSDERIFNISTNRIAKILEKDPDIKDAVVEKILPGTLKIKIKEKEPYAKLNIDEKFYYIDDKGALLYRDRSNKNLPVIIGVKIDKPVLGESCVVPELEDILSILHLGDDIGWGKFIMPVKLEVINGEYILVNTREYIMIKLKLKDVREQLEKLLVILNDVQKKGRLIKIVDLRFKDVYME